MQQTSEQRENVFRLLPLQIAVVVFRDDSDGREPNDVVQQEVEERADSSQVEKDLSVDGIDFGCVFGMLDAICEFVKKLKEPENLSSFRKTLLNSLGDNYPSCPPASLLVIVSSCLLACNVKRSSVLEKSAKLVSPLARPH